ncbi:S41 family peptidase [Echinicola sediminis]
MRSTFYTLFALIIILFSGTSCQDEIDDPIYIQDTVKTAIFASMHEWYFWNEELPQHVDFSVYQSYGELLEALKYKELDRWSYLTTPEAFDKAFTGQNVGHGFGWALNSEEELYLAFVYEDSPAGKDGWQRGWKVIQINDRKIADYKTSAGYRFDLGANESGQTNTFTFELPDGSTITRTIPKENYQSNSVLYKGTIDRNNEKIGYLAYNSFKATAGLSPTQSTEVKEAFDYFESENIDELIIDLRYNGGGSVSVAEQIMNRLVPASADGKVMYTNRHNPNKTDLDDATAFSKEGGLELGRIFFITSGGSASASELTINCLNPYMDILLIGQNTYGKPVGAFPVSAFNKALKKYQVELVPITFSTANADGKAEYYEGFPVDYRATDGLSYDWGNPEEPRLNAALHYISNGSFPPSERQLIQEPSWKMIDDFEGLQKEFPVY